MFGFIQEKLLLIALPIILAPLVTLFTQWTKKAWSWLDEQHPLVKQGVAAAYSAAFAVVASAIGQSICTDGSALCDATALDWRVILTFAGSLAIHGWKKSR